MEVLHLPRGVALTPAGALTKRPRNIVLRAFLLVPPTIALAIWLSMMRQPGNTFGLSELLILGSGVVVVGVGLLAIPAVRPGMDGSLTANLCHTMSWVFAMTMLPALALVVLSIYGMAEDTGRSYAIPLACGVGTMVAAADASHLMARIMRCLDGARRGDRIMGPAALW